ncbi:hypothetical protein Y032_0045g1248 [Ancylostoma ceylanicum]|nr:hypothetical protein Y032_0045g1248 [Ancylostoma ceylanicum]
MNDWGRILRRVYCLRTADDDIVIDDVVVAARGIAQQRIQRKATDLHAYENPVPFEHFVGPEAVMPQPMPPLKPPLGRIRSYSIDVWYK